MRPSSLWFYFPTYCYIYIISLFLLHSQVRSQSLNGILSIYAEDQTEYNSLNTCLQGCLFLQPFSGNNGLLNILGCDLPAPNACYCRSDKLQIATNAISSCITKDCTNVDNIDISTAIKVYNDYCSTVSAQDLVVTTDVASGATTSDAAAPTPTRTAASPTNTSSGGNTNCQIGSNNSGTVNCNDGGNNNQNSQTSGASSSGGSGGGLSRPDKIAIGVGLGVGIPPILFAIWACVERYRDEFDY